MGRLLGLAILLVSCAPQEPDAATVRRVVDGDTVIVVVGGGAEERVRVIGIDAPESHESQKLDRDAARSGRDVATIQELGRRASVHAKVLLEGQTVTLEFGDTSRDKYRRLLAYLRLSDGRDFGQVMIAEGYATAYRQFPHARMEAYVRSERAAREARVGLWADYELRPPEIPREKAGWIASRRSKVYHPIDCPNADEIKETNVILFATEEAAKGSGRRRCRDQGPVP